jgi:hypothetical protein
MEQTNLESLEKRVAALEKGLEQVLQGRTQPRERKDWWQAFGRAVRCRKLPWIGIAGAFVAVFAVAALGIFIYWPTPDAVVRIESNDPDVEVVFDKGGATIKAADNQEICLKPGIHSVVVKRGDFEFEADKFVIKNGERVTFKIELLKGKMRLIFGDRMVGERNFPPQR